ncbi:cobalamin biosynthesis protein CbiX [Rhodococcus ruber Chol-4]|uniref:Cobalamin biosynthesis protein CbiX n=1 Tax=Rhodococcus ruber TaxID=1830 RepID=A0A098BNV8_9NOCA|nr:MULTISPECIES: CbiX/SirB N-terminal domain-containing protein [Rhodococcus]MDO2378032.1 sirohydrochlorin chelatase [Rhodococcus ruber]NGR06273.1 sirohydrochlorin chelatase [bacterium SGD-2]RIK14345.1 MAG: sirohydrochlorin chelatase [Acidobacteriota bacterium]AWG99812.1 sirohydrochlorin chelatase [Rhodococcus ruber]KXF87454.1 cobalamin biosynthesis protein CbiX [Rhodococcus ruber Chol-4]
MTDPALLLVAHGTRNPRGVETIAALADAVSHEVGTTRVAFVDVLGPSPSEVLRRSGRPTVLVPAFLASGYHVHADVPREVTDSGHRAVAVTRALGPDPVLARVQLQRLAAAGWRPGDAVVLAAAGSSDPRAVGDVRRAAGMLSALARVAVRVGYVATGSPRVPDVVAELRAAGARRVFVASYLLADGLFHARLADAGADGVAAPLGVHDSIVRLVADRYRSAATALLTAEPLRR